jgi:hypothetical protein
MKRSISRSNPATEPAPAAEPRGVSGSDGAVSTESVRVAEPGRPARPYALWPLLAERGIQQPAAPRWALRTTGHLLEGRRPVELLEPRRPEAFDEEERRRSRALNLKFTGLAQHSQVDPAV